MPKKNQSKEITELKTTPFQGGMNTRNEPGLLAAGAYSAVRNMRQMRPGLKQRPGTAKQHSTADSTNRVLSLFQFSKGSRTERHFYAQMSDGDVLEATTAPPGITTGAFGSEVHDGSANQIPASWSVLNDQLIYSNGVDQHQLCAGTQNPVLKFIVYDSNTALPVFPEIGYDYTSQVNDSSSTTVAVLDSLGTLIALTGTLADTVKDSYDLDLSSGALLTETRVGQPYLVGTTAVGYLNFIATITDNNNATVTTAWPQNKLEVMTLDVAPATAWSVGDTITGQSSSNTCKIVSIISTLQYIISDRSGAFTLGEVLTNGTVTADQGASNPTTLKVDSTSNDCILICTPIPPNRITWTVSAANGNVSEACASYWVGGTAKWKVVSGFSDGTSSSSKTLAQTGAMTWTQPTDAVPHYMYGVNGFWTKISFGKPLDSEVEVSGVTYGSGFVSLQDIWSGALVDAVEAQVYDQSATTYYIYGSTSISVGGIVATNDKVIFASPDPIVGFYVDVAGTPNTTASTTINDVEYLASTGTWTDVSNYVDGTAGLSKSGFVTFDRQTNISKLPFNKSSYSAYWYRFSVSRTLSASCNIGIQVMPYYSINDWGVGLCNATWKSRAVYVFDQDPSYVAFSAANAPMVLSDSDLVPLEVGDGRNNKIVCMKPFYNELLVAQEEKGEAGGCLTLIQGTNADNTGKIIISNKYGSMNANCMEVVETIEGGHMAYILSRYGILVTDGRTIGFIPGFDDVRNYFDPSSSTCIRVGYESKMYLSYDSSYHVLKIGLVSGSSATDNNVFLVYDLIQKCFMDDSYANNLSCEKDCDAASGNVPVVRLGGGQADGTVYLLNYGTNDVSTAVDSYVTIELNNYGRISRTGEMVIRTDTQTVGRAYITPYYNGVEQSTLKQEISLKSINSADERMRRHRIPLNFVDQNVSVKIEHNEVGEGFYIFDWAVKLEEYSEQ